MPHTITLQRPTTPRLALVIGAGGIKCAAALGVWKALNAARIPIDLTVGCSGGSLFAAGMALGYSLEQSVDLTYKLWTPHVAKQRDIPNVLSAMLPRVFGFEGEFGLINDRALLQGLEQGLGGSTFADTQRPLRIATTDVLTGESVILSSGRLLDAIRASIAIPLVFSPWRVNGRLLIDGAVSNPLPIDAAVKENADIIIAVSFTFPTQPQLNSAVQFAGQLTNILCNNLMQARLAHSSLAHHAEIIPVEIDFGQAIKITDTDKIPDIVAAGEAAMQPHIPYLQQLLSA